MVNSPCVTLSFSTRAPHFEVGLLLGSEQSKIPVLVHYKRISQTEDDIQERTMQTTDTQYNVRNVWKVSQ